MTVFTYEIFSNLESKRKELTPYQKQVLMKRFQANPYLKLGEKHKLAESLNISAKSIDIWFTLRRYWTRKKGLLRKYIYE